jgi:hypothetical protein
MTIQYQNTIDDLREALTVVAREESRNSRTSRLILVAAMVVGIYLGFQALNQRIGPSVRPLFAVNNFITGISVILLMCLVNIATIIRMRAWRNLWVVIINVGIVGMLLGEWALLRAITGGLIIAWPTPAWLILLPHLPWISFILLILVLATFRQFRAQKSLWTGNPLLQRPKNAEIVATGITISDDSARLEYQWSAFSKYRETKNLLVLFFGPSTYLMIPKRAFGSAQELDAMRAMATMISPRGAVGFPIEQTGGLASIPPPLPAQQHV